MLLTSHLLDLVVRTCDRMAILSAGRTLAWGDQSLSVASLNDETIQNFDIALFSAGSSVGAEWASGDSVVIGMA